MMAIVKVYDFNLISPATSIPLFHMMLFSESLSFPWKTTKGSIMCM